VGGGAPKPTANEVREFYSVFVQYYQLFDRLKNIAIACTCSGDRLLRFLMPFAFETEYSYG
jgi:hypothetical protein